MNPRAHETALLFPTGGYHWPGMGTDLLATSHREVFTRAEAALRSCGVAPGALIQLLAGKDQARRVRTDDRWTWEGDFPLSMVAQMALGVALSGLWCERHGSPRVLAGESMGELAAYCVAGALPLADTAVLTYRWAADLQAASDALGLRMAVVEDLDPSDVAELAGRFDGRIVVSEAPRLCVVALPAARLGDLEQEVAGRGGATLVSNNPCAAHDPRLATLTAIWEAHARYLASLAFAAPRLPLLDTLAPGGLLQDPAALRRNRHDTSFQRVRWDETLRQLPALGIRRVVMFGPPSCGYAFKKFRAAVPGCAGLRLATVAVAAAV
jgi:malonyl CoA-acyl carrier protein transacylase